MYTVTPWRSLPSTAYLKYLSGSENIRLLAACNGVGKIRIGKFVLPFNRESLIVVPPFHACTLYIPDTKEVSLYELPWRCLSKLKRQRLLANMYLKPLVLLNPPRIDWPCYLTNPITTNEAIIELIEHVLNEVAQDDLVTPIPCDKVFSLANRLLDYIAQSPPTLDYLNVFVVAQYLQCATRSLQRVGNRVFGLPVHSVFGYHLAMEGADRVLYQGESVKEAARVIGYSTGSAFQKCFKLRIGTTLPEFLDLILKPV